MKEVRYAVRMTSLVIELDDDVLRRLEPRAREAGLPVEAYVASLAETAAEAVDPQVIAVMDELIEQYRPVFDRLAQ